MNMAADGTGFLHQSSQFSARDLGAALSRIVRRRYGASGAAKALERQWRLDPEAAKNLVSREIASATTLAKALGAEGMTLWHDLGVELTGETYAQAEERRLQEAIKEAERARQELVEGRARCAALERRAAQLDPLRSWAPPERQRERRG